MTSRENGGLQESLKVELENNVTEKLPGAARIPEIKLYFEIAVVYSTFNLTCTNLSSMARKISLAHASIEFNPYYSRPNSIKGLSSPYAIPVTCTYAAKRDL